MSLSFSNSILGTKGDESTMTESHTSDEQSLKQDQIRPRYEIDESTEGKGTWDKQPVRRPE